MSPPVEIQMIPHETFQVPNFQVLRALNKIIIEIVNERLRQGILESCHGPY